MTESLANLSRMGVVDLTAPTASISDSSVGIYDIRPSKIVCMVHAGCHYSGW